LLLAAADQELVSRQHQLRGAGLRLDPGLLQQGATPCQFRFQGGVAWHSRITSLTKTSVEDDFLAGVQRDAEMAGPVEILHRVEAAVCLLAQEEAVVPIGVGLESPAVAGQGEPGGGAQRQATSVRQGIYRERHGKLPLQGVMVAPGDQRRQLEFHRARRCQEAIGD